MKITLTRTGGITGIPLTKTIDTATLPTDKAKEIESLVSSTGQSSIVNNKSSIQSPDRFTYHLSIQDGVTAQEVTINEQDLSEEMHQLITSLEKI